MKIAISVDPEVPVPPIYYGGIERVVSMLIIEFIRAGHEVTLFAHEESKTPARLKPYYGKNSKSRIDSIRNMHIISREIFNGDYDVLHSFSRLAYLTFVLPTRIPKIMSYQRRPTITQIKKAQKIAHKDSLIFTGCSNFISNQIRPFGNVCTIYNGFPQDKYTFNPKVSTEAPLIFLGRIEPIKGPHHAITIALRSQKKLIIAGNVPSEYEDWFEEKIKPYLDGNQIRYVGPLNDEEKSILLGSALAFLMPIEWDEPFGIVMAEAMACGTPVIALSRGASSEIISQGITGFLCETIDECIEKVSAVHTLNRTRVREVALLRFSASVIAKNYLQLYREQINKVIKL